MVKQKIFNSIVIILLITGNHYSQSAFEQNSKKVFSGLITIDKKSEYEDGYWFDK